MWYNLQKKSQTTSSGFFSLLTPLKATSRKDFNLRFLWANVWMQGVNIRNSNSSKWEEVLMFTRCVTGVILVHEMKLFLFLFTYILNVPRLSLTRIFFVSHRASLACFCMKIPLWKYTIQPLICTSVCLTEPFPFPWSLKRWGKWVI